MRYITYIIVSIFTIFTLSGCGSMSGNYSLSGSSILPEWKTIYISPFPNNAPLINPSLSQELNLTLQDAFRNRTKLNLTGTEDADLVIEGEITGYDVVPMSIQGNDIAAENRLTINVRVRYINNVDETKSFDRTFTAYENFDGTLMLSDVESSIVPNIIDIIRDQVFAAVAMDW
ncbi:MAG TPA: LptE family protein [Faecalibacter sp.]|uniref:LptE family protein n=1 Tax=Faecalibacter sp. LW9 TaxID=3103144 RepID=UPI002AFFE68E|nr:LptE family protein [Faecalibacter sp. LW9]